MKKILFIFTILFSFISIHADDVVWTGSVNSSWHTAGNWQSGSVPTNLDVAVFKSTSSNNADITSNISVGGIRIEAGYFGTVTQSGGSITVGVYGYNQSGGSFVGGASAISVSGYFSVDGGFFTATSGALTLSGAIVSVTGGIFYSNNGTIHKTGGGATWNITQSINNLDINTQGSFNSGFLRVLGNVDARGWNAHHGIIEVEGNYTTYFTSQSTSSGTIIFKGSNNQILSANGASGCVPSIEVNKTNGILTVNDTILVRLDWTNISSGTNVDVSNAEIRFVYENDITSNGMIFNNITVACPGWFRAVDKMTITGLAKFNSFNVVHGLIETSGDVLMTDNSQSTSSGTLKFIGSNNQSLSAAGNFGVFPNIMIQKTGGVLSVSDTIKLSLGLTWVSGAVDASNATFVFCGGSQTIDAEGINFGNVEINTQGNITLARPLKVDGNLTITAINAISGERVEIKGNFNYTDTFFWGNGVEAYLVGSNNQSVSVAGTSGLRKSIFINKTGGTVSLASDLSLNNGWQNINIINGTLDLNGYNLSLGGTLKNSGLVKLIGSEIVNIGSLDNSGQGTVSYTGTGAYSSFALGDDYYHLNVAGSVTQDYQLTVLGDLNISGTLNSNGHNLYLAGKFNNTGTYISGNNSVYLIGGNQIIVGSNTFNHLIKRSNTTASLTFPAGVSQTVTGTLELVGTAGNLLTLKSAVTNSAWTINHTGSVNRLGYLSISDSTSVSTLDAKSNSVDGGNNTNWVFNSVNALVWTGAVNTNFSNAGNWVGGFAPTANDVIEFLSGSNAISIDIDANVAGIVLGSSFSGSVTLAANKTLNVGYNGITISGGTFNGNTKTITTSGDFVISGGTFNSNSCAVEIIGGVEISSGAFNSSTTSLKVGGNWVKTGGTFNALGSVTLNGFGGQTVLAGGTDGASDFADFIVSFGTVTIASPLKVNGNLTINSGQLKNSSTIQLAGNLTNNSGFINDQTGSLWVINGSTAQNIKLQNHVVKTVHITNTTNKVTFLDELNAIELIGDAGTSIVIEKDKFVVLNNLTLNGTLAQPISLKSNIAQQNARVVVSGVQTLSYVDVRGIDGQYGPTLNGTNNCVDLGYNVNWAFPDNSGKPAISFTPASDSFETAVTVTLVSTGTAPVIHYTLDGSTPTTASPVYSAPLNLTATTTIKAISVDGSTTSTIFGKVYQAVQSAIDDGLVYPIKSYGLNALIYLGDVRRFEGQAWHVGPDGLMNTSDDYRVPEFDKYMVWSCTGGTIQKIDGTGGAIFTDDGFTSSYTVTLTLGPKSFTGCNNNTPVRESGQRNIISGAPDINSNGNIPIEDLRKYGMCAFSPSNSPIPLPTNGDSVELHIVRDAGFYNIVPFSLGKAARMSGFNEIKVISSNRIIALIVNNKAGAWFPFDADSTGKYYRDGGEPGYIEKILESNVLVGFKYTEPSGRVSIYKKLIGQNQYRVTETSDSIGNKIVYDYQSTNFLLITDASGNRYEVFADAVVDGVNQISKIVTKPFGTNLSKTWLYTYNVDGFIATEKFEDLYNLFGYGEFVFTSDIHGNATLFQDYKGNQYRLEYDDVWRVTKSILPTGDATLKSYTGKNGFFETKVIDPLGHSYTNSNNQTPYLVQFTKEVTLDGLITEYQYNSKGFIVQKKMKPTSNSADDIIVNYEYDLFHYLIKETHDPDGLNLITRFEYDANGNLTKIIDANGRVTLTTYNNLNLVTSITEDFGGLNLVTTMTYDSAGNKISNTDPLGKTETFEYDSFGNLIRMNDKSGKFLQWTYDPFGNNISSIDKNGNTTLLDFDVNNRLIKKTDAAGFFELYEYDGNNNLTRFTNEIGQVEVRTYNSLDFVISIGGDASGPSGCNSCGAANSMGLEGLYSYTWNGKVTQFTDANYLETSGASGNITIFEYDLAYRNTIKVVDPLGLALMSENTYDKLGRLVEFRKINHDGADEIVRNDYDKYSRLVATRKILGNTSLVTQYEYDQTQNVTRITDPNGNFTQFEFDGVYRTIKTIDAENTEYTKIYNARSDLLKTIANPAGFAQTTEFVYNDRGEAVQIIRPNGGIEIYEYDFNGNKTKATDSMGGVKEWFYDNRNLIIKIKDEAGFETNYSYDGLRNKISVTNNQGVITAFEYGEKSFLKKTIEDVGGINKITQYTHDEYGLVIDTIDASNVVYRNVYDAAYRIVQQIADVGSKNIPISTIYDSLSRPIKTIDSGGFETEILYDQVSRKTKVIMPDGGEQSFTYDNMANALQVVAKVNGVQNYTVGYEYNGIYQLTKMIEDKDGLQIATQKNYDSLHRLSSVVDAKNQSTSYEYDIEDRITKEIYADGGFVSKSYDLKGRLISKTDQSGDECLYTYDARDLLLQQTYGSVGIKSFSYDSLGRKISQADNNSGQMTVLSTYSFDNLHRRLTDTQTIGSGASLTDTVSYNVFGDITQHTLPSGKLIMKTYTSVHQPSAIVADIGFGQEILAKYEYNYESIGSDLRPLLKKKILSSSTGVKTNFIYDSMGRQSLIESKNGINTTVVGFEYSYNLIGNLVTDKHLHNLVDSQTYNYDTAQRLNSYKRGIIGDTPIFTQDYTLDALANWSSFNSNGVVENRTHNITNGISAIDSLPISHDIKGNQLNNKDGNSYYWDKLNRLIEVRNASNQQVALYFYNADNLRVQKTTNSNTEQYYYSGSRVVVETDGNQNVTKQYIHGSQYVDEVITVITGGSNYHYLYDSRFNVYGLIDNQGNILERARYQGYGKLERLNSSFSVITSPLVDQPYSYTGQRLDTETGLQYFRARYYDADLGRFISRDPIGYVDGLNLYRGYFSPNGVDPTGEWFGSLSGALLGAIISGTMQLALNPNATRGEIWGAMVSGAITGGFIGGVLTGDALGVMTIAQLSTLGAASSYAGSIVRQLTDKGKINNEEVYIEMAAGAIISVAVPIGGTLANIGRNTVVTYAKQLPTWQNWIGGGGGYNYSATARNIVSSPKPISSLPNNVSQGAKNSCPNLAKNEPLLLPAPKVKPTGRPAKPTKDSATGYEVGQFSVDPNGIAMIQPVGGKTVQAGRGGVSTHTLYPNGSNYQRLDIVGHANNNTPHGHGHLLGTGFGPRLQGPSIDIFGNEVPWNSAEAHWQLFTK